jgi:hypothetical protein
LLPLAAHCSVQHLLLWLSGAQLTPCSPIGLLFTNCPSHVASQVKADVYEKIDKELLEFVEDVLLNRCDNATERMMEYAATLEPKCKPTDVKKKGQAATQAEGKKQVGCV